MKKIIFFDVWETLIHSRNNAECSRILEDVVANSESNKSDFFKSWAKHWFIKNSSYDEFLNAICRDFPKVTMYRANIKTALNLHEKDVEIYPDVVPALKRLSKKCELGLISDCGSDTPIILQQLGLSSRFKYRFFSCECGAAKASGLYRHVLAQRIIPHLMIGDNILRDYQIPRSLGIKSLLLDRGLKYREIEDTITGLDKVEVPYG